VLLVLSVVTLSPLLNLVAVDVLRLTIGILLVSFGISWLRKAILRSAGIIPLKDEAFAFTAETVALREQAHKGQLQGCAPRRV
jgi:uncharacterized membrane protein